MQPYAGSVPTLAGDIFDPAFVRGGSVPGVILIIHCMYRNVPTPVGDILILNL